MPDQPHESKSNSSVRRGAADAENTLPSDQKTSAPDQTTNQMRETATELGQTQPHVPKQPGPATEMMATAAGPAAPPTAAKPSVGDTASPNLATTSAHVVSTTQELAKSLVVEQGASKDQKISALGGYKLIKKLGEGGMGSVYKAYQANLERDAAVKVLTKHLAADRTFVERFKREARIMVRLKHANLVECYDLGEEHGWHYCAMEYLDGGSMQSWLDKLGKLTVADALCVTLACARGLQHAHDQGIIHRDIKPDNILLTSKGVVKVADMGLAKAHGENVTLTRTGTGAGTPIYMSPEQARDAKHVDHRTDIYSLGCMLYTFLAGKPPFSGETYVELFEAKEKCQFAPIRKLNPEVPDRLGLMLDKMLEKRLEIRYQSCAEVIRDLESLGLAGASPSFLQAPKPASAVCSAATEPSVRAPAAPPKAAPKPRMAGNPPPSRSPHEAGRDIWYVSYRDDDGKPKRRRMTTEQLRSMVREEDFDVQAQASRTQEGDYRSLASYPEFEHALRGRLAKAKADRKTAKFKAMYKEIEEDEKRRRRWRWFNKLFRGGVGLVGSLIYLLMIGALLLGVFILFKYGVDWLGTKMESMTK